MSAAKTWWFRGPTPRYRRPGWMTVDPLWSPVSDDDDPMSSELPHAFARISDGPAVRRPGRNSGSCTASRGFVRWLARIIARQYLGLQARRKAEFGENGSRASS